MIDIAVQEKTPARPVWAYLAVLLALTSPLIQFAFGPVFKLFPFPVDRFVSLWVFWIISALVLFYSVRVEGIPLSTFGIGKNTRSLRYRLIEMIAALITGVIVLIILLLFSQMLRGFLNMPSTSGIELVTILPFWVTLPAWLTAAFCEELLFRSYPIERLTLLTGKRWMAAVLSMLMFTILHLPAWDWVHLVTMVFPASVLITGIYLWRRSFWFVVVIHAVMNLPILFLPFIAPYL